MLEDTSWAHVVSWGPHGDCFVVKDMNEFTKTILPRMFKHSNFASFVRQLNKYDFHKVCLYALCAPCVALPAHAVCLPFRRSKIQTIVSLASRCVRSSLFVPDPRDTPSPDMAAPSPCELPREA